MANPNREFVSTERRRAQISTLAALFISYEIATVLSLFYDHRDGSTTGGFAWMAILIAATYYEVYRRFAGRDKWVMAVFVLLAATAIVLTMMLFHGVGLFSAF